MTVSDWLSAETSTQTPAMVSLATVTGINQGAASGTRLYMTNKLQSVVAKA